MDEKQKRGLVFLASLFAVAGVVWYYSRKRAIQISIAENAAENGDKEEDAFYAPWKWATPGVYPDAAGFQSTINVYTNNPLAASLAYQYMPIFGLVGFNTAGFPGA